MAALGWGVGRGEGLSRVAARRAPMGRWGRMDARDLSGMRRIGGVVFCFWVVAP
jgi:hypothetical protein